MFAKLNLKAIKQVLLIIGVVLTNLKLSTQAAAIDLEPEEEGRLIVLEPQVVSRVGSDDLVPTGRYGLGFLVAAGYALINPINYQPDAVELSFEDTYGLYRTGGMQLTLGPKWNLSFASISVDAAVGFYNVKSDTDVVMSELNLVPVELGSRIFLDHMFSQPWVVPFAGAGAYTVIFSEKQAGTEFGGSTQVSWFWTAGLSVLLDWLDPIADRSGFYSSGLENSFLTLAVKQYQASFDEVDPDFSTSIDPYAAITLEF